MSCSATVRADPFENLQVPPDKTALSSSCPTYMKVCASHKSASDMPFEQPSLATVPAAEHSQKAAENTGEHNCGRPQLRNLTPFL